MSTKALYPSHFWSTFTTSWRVKCSCQQLQMGFRGLLKNYVHGPNTAPRCIVGYIPQLADVSDQSQHLDTFGAHWTMQALLYLQIKDGFNKEHSGNLFCWKEALGIIEWCMLFRNAQMISLCSNDTFFCNMVRFHTSDPPSCCSYQFRLYRWLMQR